MRQRYVALTIKSSFEKLLSSPNELTDRYRVSVSNSMTNALHIGRRLYSSFISSTFHGKYSASLKGRNCGVCVFRCVLLNISSSMFFLCYLFWVRDVVLSTKSPSFITSVFFFLTLSSWCSWLCVFNEVPLLYNLNAFFLCCTCGYSWCYFIPEFQRPLELRSVGLWYCFVNKFPFFWNSNNDTSCSDGLFVPYLCLNFHSRFFI